MLSDKQEAFAREYAVDRNATQAAIRAGYSWPNAARGYYVYFLIDGRSDDIFYVGKGIRNRIKHHRRSAYRFGAQNAVKAKRIRECGDDLVERIFAEGLSEPNALNIEKILIHRFRGMGITNITSGYVHPLESELARIDASIDAIRPFDEWVKIMRPAQIESVTKAKGSPEKFYAFFLGMLLRLREQTEARLIAMNIERYAV